MRDFTTVEQRAKIKYRLTDRCTEEVISHINDGQDDYVELIRCNRKHFILRSWYVEAHYSSQSAALKDLSRFMEEHVQ